MDGRDWVPVLLPCPFCGAMPKVSFCGAMNLDKTEVACENDDCDVNPCVTGFSPVSAREKWNARPASPGGDAADLAREVADLRGRERDALAMILFVGMCAGDRIAKAVAEHESELDHFSDWNSECRGDGWERGYERGREDLSTAIVAAERERDEARAVLQRVEWRLDDGEDRCPICAGHRIETYRHLGGHRRGCDLAAALAPRPSGVDPGRGTGNASKGVVGNVGE